MEGIMVEPVLASPVDRMRRVSILTIKTNLPMDSFPEYQDPFSSSDDTMTESPSTLNPANRLVEKTRGTEVSRHPSPQPTHVSYPKMNGNGHRVLRSATVGYVAPEFKGKAEQMKQGEHCQIL